MPDIPVLLRRNLELDECNNTETRSGQQQTTFNCRCDWLVCMLVVLALTGEEKNSER